jgi:hypothetical protein
MGNNDDASESDWSDSGDIDNDDDDDDDDSSSSQVSIAHATH